MRNGKIDMDGTLFRSDGHISSASPEVRPTNIVAFRLKFEQSKIA